MDDQQQDANSALMELDKGLRAQKVGQQCEAIVRFPGLFEHFPFPILINSAFLKLADAFRVENNFLRLCILRVAQQSHKHLDKIVNVTEFRKRICAVIHSNDPYARAITLRMLGSIACIISDEKSVHHSIRQGLDSHDRVEQEASIYATIQFASYSEEFATSICNKISAMLQGLSTPLEIKLKLIPVLQHMHYDVQISSKSWTVLKDLLPAYPAQEFVVATLNTLTNLSLHSLVDIPAQVSFLLQHLRCDPREAVKTVILKNLNSLAAAGPHLWSVDDTNELCKCYLLPTMQLSLKGAILQALCTLTSGNSALHLNINEGSELINLCRKYCCDRDIRQAALATRLLALLASHAAQSDQVLTSLKKDLIQESTDAVESLLLIIAPTSDTSSRDKSTLQMILPAVNEICLSSDHDTVMRFVDVLINLLTVDCEPDGEVAEMLCEILASVAMKSQKPGCLQPFSGKLLDLLGILTSCGENEEKSTLQIVTTHVCTLLFISNRPSHKHAVGKKIFKLLTKSESSANKWTWYRVARQASRIGEHKLACDLFQKLSSAVVSEQYYFWLNTLHQFELAEAILLEETKESSSQSALSFQSVLFKAVEHYHNGMTSLNAAVSPDHQFHFQVKFCKLRCNTLLSHARLLMTCNQIHLSPPPAILDPDLASTSSSHKEEILSSRCAILRQQLRECANEFNSLASDYGTLHISSFDADQSTLSNIDILQRTCSVMAHAIETIINSIGQDLSSIRTLNSSHSVISTESSNHQSKIYSEIFTQILSKVDKSLLSASTSLSNVHMKCLHQCSSILLSIPISFPRYFYQSLQTTTIKLAISPNQRSPNEPISVDISERLALKIEGVIRQVGSRGVLNKDEPSMKTNGNSVLSDGKMTQTFRKVGEIRLTVKTTPVLQGKHAVSHSSKPRGIVTDSLEQTVKPHNDYFSTQFLLHIPVIGNHNVIIESSLVDDNGICWQCGPTESLTVRCSDDSIRVKTLMQQSQDNHK